MTSNNNRTPLMSNKAGQKRTETVQMCPQWADKMWQYVFEIQETPCLAQKWSSAKMKSEWRKSEHVRVWLITLNVTQPITKHVISVVLLGTATFMMPSDFTSTCWSPEGGLVEVTTSHLLSFHSLTSAAASRCKSVHRERQRGRLNSRLCFVLKHAAALRRV